MVSIKRIIRVLDKYIKENGKTSIDAFEADRILLEAGLLKGPKRKIGTVIGVLLRQGLLPHAYKVNGFWRIPHSSGKIPYQNPKINDQGVILEKPKTITSEEYRQRLKAKKARTLSKKKAQERNREDDLGISPEILDSLARDRSRVDKLKLELSELILLEKAGIHTIDDLCILLSSKHRYQKFLGGESTAKIVDALFWYYLSNRSSKNKVTQNEQLEPEHDEGGSYYLLNGQRRIPIEVLDLSSRTYKALLSNDFQYIDELNVILEGDGYKHVRNFGKVTQEELRKALGDYDTDEYRVKP